MVLQVSIRTYHTYKAVLLVALAFRNSDRICLGLLFHIHKSIRLVQAEVYRSSDRTFLYYQLRIHISMCLLPH